jgi:hypothetical protein
MPYTGISDNSLLMVQHFIRGLNDNIIGNVKIFQPISLKDTFLQALLLEVSMNSAQGGLENVQARGSSYSGLPQGNQSQGVGSSKNPPTFSKGNQEQQGRKFFHGRNGGS